MILILFKENDGPGSVAYLSADNYPHGEAVFHNVSEIGIQRWRWRAVNHRDGR